MALPPGASSAHPEESQILMRQILNSKNQTYVLQTTLERPRICGGRSGWICTKLSLWKFMELTWFFFLSNCCIALSVSSFCGFDRTGISYYSCCDVPLPCPVHHYLPHYLLCTTLSVCLNHPIHKMGLIILALIYLEQILLGKMRI